MRPRTAVAALVLFFGVLPSSVRAADPGAGDLDQQFIATVKPFLGTYCVTCHGGAEPDAQFDLTKFNHLADVVQDHPHWALVLEKLSAKQMPPKEATEFPTDEARQQVIEWIKATRRAEAVRHAGDPGL